MATNYYINGRDGAGFVDATIHTDRECASEVGAVRPLASSTVDAIDPEWCPDCAGGDSDDEDASTSTSDVTDDEPTGVCEVVKSDGEECGRDRPCPYHDKR